MSGLRGSRDKQSVTKMIIFVVTLVLNVCKSVTRRGGAWNGL